MLYDAGLELALAKVPVQMLMMLGWFGALAKSQCS